MRPIKRRIYPAPSQGEGHTIAHHSPRAGAADLSFLQSLAVLFKLRIVALLLFAAVAGHSWRPTAARSRANWRSCSSRADWRLRRFGPQPISGKGIRRGAWDAPQAAVGRGGHRPAGWVPYVASLMILGPRWRCCPSIPPWRAFLLAGRGHLRRRLHAVAQAAHAAQHRDWRRAGSAAVLSAAPRSGVEQSVGGGAGPTGFLWTPTHFWSLAIVYRNDYRQKRHAHAAHPGQPARFGRVGGPAHHGHRVRSADARRPPRLGWIYFIPVAAATFDLMVRNVRLLAHPEGKQSLSLFKASNLYLALILLMICVASLVR